MRVSNAMTIITTWISSLLFQVALTEKFLLMSEIIVDFMLILLGLGLLAKTHHLNLDIRIPIRLDEKSQSLHN